MITYQSSRLTYYYKYFVLPLLVALFLYIDITTWMRGNVLSYYWTHFAAPMSLWLIAWFVTFMLQLRRLQADDSGVTIFPLFGESKKVRYDDIQYVNEVALMNPARFFLKYKDLQTGKSRKILVISFERADMTAYVRRQIEKHNPQYSPALEPSRWATPRLAFFTAIPFLLYGIVQNLTVWLTQ